ncbi:MAG TPA: hypothetical protein VIH30_03575 [Aquirhabdus sp.]
MHPRTIIREAIALELYAKGFVQDHVYVTRTAELQRQHLPAICVYTKSERTREGVSDDTFNQDLDLLIEVYVERKADTVIPFQKIEGMPNNPAQTNNADQVLDDLCFEVENVVFNLLFKNSIETGTDCIYTNQVTAINTEIDHNPDGAVPFVKASITMTISYQRSPSLEDVETCPFEKFKFDILNVTCDPDDPMNGTVAISGQQDLEGA